MDKIIKFYDDTSDYSLLEETRQFMFDTYGELRKILKEDQKKTK